MLSKSQIKYIQSLGHKKRRDEEAAFIAEGPKIVKDLINAGHIHIKQIFALREWMDSNEGMLSGFPVTEINEAELEKISLLNTPNRVLAVAAKMKWDKRLQLEGRITLALETIQDPGNMGTIIRIADWFGVKQIICSEDCAEAYNPKVVQASMGSISRIRVEYADLEKIFMENKSIRVYAATLGGRDITHMEKLREGIILIGNESKGISESLLKLSNARITIPGKGEAESLNAAVATGIILSHLAVGS